MEETSQVTQETSPIQPQKLEKPRSIKILQWVDLALFIYSIPLLLLGLASFYDPGFACGKDEICPNVIFYNSVVMSFTILSLLGFYSLLKYKAKLKIVGIISSIIVIFMFLFSFLTRFKVL